MVPFNTYTYIQCPCSDPSRNEEGDDTTPTSADRDEDDRTFDPRAPRSNYSLFPLEYLLYCEDCHEIRCPRCVAEEIAAYYCPNCIFEVPFSNIRSEGNRCTRCCQCPICLSPLSVTSLESAPNPNLLSAGNTAPPAGPYILNCGYCMWSSEEIGIKFDKPSSVAAQLPRIRNGGKPRLTAKERRERKDARDTKRTLPVVAEGDADEGREEMVDQELDAETQFANLASFYKTQLAEASASTASALSGLGDLGFSSPSSLSRIMSMYTSTDVSSLTSRRLGKGRNNVMREARTADEGFLDVQLDESGVISKLQEQGWDGTATAEQTAAQLSTLGIGPATGGNPGGGDRFVDTLRPIAYLLRAKRSKRCPICRHIISKPESQLKSSRFRIRLVAVNYVPSITIRPVIKPNPQATNDLLTPLKPVQYLLTFKNPIFEPVKVTLATPAVTPGRFASKVTVLCPQFDISANSDEWEVALRDGTSPALPGSKENHGQGGQHQAEAGKIWDRGRNWTSIVVEVVPASLRLDVLELANKRVGKSSAQETKDVDVGALKEDEDVLEIPMFVRVEWEAEAGNDEVGATPGERDRDAKIKRELAYWTVLGIGRISQE